MTAAKKPSSNDDSSNFTKLTTSLHGSSGWSSSTLSMTPDLIAPLNDMAGESSHTHTSRRSSLNGSSHHSRRSQSNSLGGSSHHTRGSCDRSVGESSLSSFLSVLLEEGEGEEETRPREISIVPDNPRPEQRSIQELRLSFIRSAYKNDKPKDRWEYLTRDNNDREQMLRMKRRSKLEVRSSSFSGAISNTKHTFSSSSPTLSPNDSFSGKGRSQNTANMFLRMPQRKSSPMTEAVGKKSIMSRCVNMSDSDLIILPMQPGSTLSTSKTSSPDNRGMSRFGVHKANSGNATWTKADVREQRKKNSNQFLELLLEPEGDAKSFWPSPLPSPSPHQTSDSSMQISQRQLSDLANSFFSLDHSSDEEEETEEEKEDDEEAIAAPMERLSISTPHLNPQGASSMSSRPRNMEEKSSSKPPQIPTRYRGSPMNSPNQIKEQQKLPTPPPPPPLI